MIIHNLKSKSVYFKSVWDGSKTFEIRKNDRGFSTGDFLILQEWDKPEDLWAPLRYMEHGAEQHTGAIILAKVTYTSTFEQQEGYIVLGIQVLECKDLRAVELTYPEPGKHCLRTKTMGRSMYE